jgi:arylsulfatase
VRDVPGWPRSSTCALTLTEKAPRESGLYLRWYADNIWLFVPVQEKLKAFLSTLPEFPFQQGSSLNAAGINYNSIQAMQAMQRLKQLETLPAPAN